jgi:FkbM family methyltransferase
MLRLARRLHLHRVAPAWERSREIAPSRIGLAAMWWTLGLGVLERYVPALRSDRQRALTVAGPHGRRRLHLRANAWDTFTFYEVFLKEVYRSALPLPPGATVVDLGANIGLASAYFSMYSPDCRLIAVEPDEQNRAMLERNLEGVRARVVDGAIDAESGTATLAIGASVRHHLARPGEAPAAATREVLTLTIDDLLEREERRQIDVLKVDIEGAEQQAFASPSRSLARVQMVIMEIHNPESASQIERVLDSAGLRHEPRPDGKSYLDVPDVFRRAKEQAPHN